MIEVVGKFSTAKIYVNEMDKETYSQIFQLVNHPSFTNNVRIMPDVHAGASNSVIGFTMPLTHSIIPNTVGVDIGCGMISAQLSLKKEAIDFAQMDKKIRQVVPIGNRNGTHKSSPIQFEKDFPFDRASDILWKFTQSFNKHTSSNYTPISYTYEWFEKLCKRVGAEIGYAETSLGTLGGGNHFIELGEASSDQSLWLTVHSGSRKLGGDIAKYHTAIAKRNAGFDKDGFDAEFKKLKAKLRTSGQAQLINEEKFKLREKYSSPAQKVQSNMEYLEGQSMYDYFVDMIFAQVYAEENRKLMLSQMSKILKADLLDTVQSVHNYIDFSDMVIRKGAIRAYVNERMIIPFNMADGILICEGKSNEAWNCSGPHGAGRLMSRTKAKENIDMEDYKVLMKKNNVFSTSISEATLDEAPQAYKSAQMIEEAVEPTANILFKLKPIYNLKAGD
jgi:RNA-splicing ligase RtcB